MQSRAVCKDVSFAAPLQLLSLITGPVASCAHDAKGGGRGCAASIPRLQGYNGAISPLFKGSQTPLCPQSNCCSHAFRYLCEWYSKPRGIQTCDAPYPSLAGVIEDLIYDNPMAVLTHMQLRLWVGSLGQAGASATDVRCPFFPTQP